MALPSLSQPFANEVLVRPHAKVLKGAVRSVLRRSATFEMYCFARHQFVVATTSSVVVRPWQHSLKLGLSFVIADVAGWSLALGYKARGICLTPSLTPIVGPIVVLPKQQGVRERY